MTGSILASGKWPCGQQGDRLSAAHRECTHSSRLAPRALDVDGEDAELGHAAVRALSWVAHQPLVPHIHLQLRRA